MIGQNLGQYRLLERVARGGMGTVFRALDETLGREVALKILDAGLDDPTHRFRAEATTIARLNHPGIATVYELFQHDGRWVMVMEFVQGDTLEQMVQQMAALSPCDAAELCIQALTPLAYAHRMGIVHRDLKPSNLMLTVFGTVKIMDFGIARVAGAEHLTGVGLTLGTPAYMAPEQVTGAAIDARADLYAIGMIFYRLTTGKLPFNSTTPFAMAQSQVNDAVPPVGLLKPDLPPWVQEIVARALSKAPQDRFQSADEFRNAFVSCLAGSPMQATSTSIDRTAQMAIPSGGPAGRGSAVWLGVAVATIAVSVIGTPWLWRSPVAPAGFGAIPVTPLGTSRLLVPPYAAQLPTALNGRNLGAAAGIEHGRKPSDRPGNADNDREAKPPTTPAAFGDVKLFVVEGVRTISRDIVLNLSNHEMTLLPNDGGAPITALAYQDVAKATYVHARDPRWEPSLNAPAAKLNVPGIFGRARHWLVVQTKDRYAILQLAADHWLNVLQTFELRTGRKIDRPAAGEARTTALTAR